MEKTITILFFFLLNFSTMLAQQASVKIAFLEKWEGSKNYLLAIAEAMPEESYNFKPTERQMSFKEQLLHIKENMTWLSNSYFTEIEYKREKTDTSISKTETVNLLENAFDSVIEIIENTNDADLKKTVDFFAGPKSKLQILNLLQDHVTHHRGQLIVYLNLNNIKPPSFIGW
jgi:uncharacterized damage-inducible protein DinB